jgi:hypothetical protein
MIGFGKPDVWRNARPAVVLGRHDQMEIMMRHPKTTFFCAVAALALAAPLFTAPAAAEMRSVPVIGGGSGGGGGAAVSRGGGAAPAARPSGGGGGHFAASRGMRPVPVMPGGSGRSGGSGGHWHGGGGHHHHHHGGRWWGPGIGFGTGFALGSAYGSYPYYNDYYDDDSYAYSPGYVESDGVSAADIAYCKQRFKSYNVRTGTYLGYDGQRHPCP